jgi:hypothetical protein
MAFLSITPQAYSTANLRYECRAAFPVFPIVVDPKVNPALVRKGKDDRPLACFFS